MKRQITITQLAHYLARENRKKPTEAEKKVWQILRGKKMLGLKFLRQNPIFYKKDNKRKFFIADFYCFKKRLVIEIDGKIHLNQKDYDQARTEIMKTKRIKVIRIKNEELLDERVDLEQLLREKIKDALKG